jgi:hypothetical protein
VTDRLRGVIIAGGFSIGVAANVIDGILESFTVWNWITIACGVFLIPYGIALATGRMESRRRPQE